MTLDAIGGAERLTLVGLDQVGRRSIVTVEAKRRRRLRQVELVLDLAFLTNLVRNVASFATHLQRSMATAAGGNVHSLFVASQTEVLVFVPRFGLDQQKFVVRGVRAVALDAIAHRWRMNRPLQFGGILVSMAA